MHFFFFFHEFLAVHHKTYIKKNEIKVSDFSATMNNKSALLYSPWLAVHWDTAWWPVSWCCTSWSSCCLHTPRWRWPRLDQPWQSSRNTVGRPDPCQMSRRFPPQDQDALLLSVNHNHPGDEAFPSPPRRCATCGRQLLWSARARKNLPMWIDKSFIGKLKF